MKNTINFNPLTPAVFAVGEKNDRDIGVAADIEAGDSVLVSADLITGLYDVAGGFAAGSTAENTLRSWVAPSAREPS